MVGCFLERGVERRFLSALGLRDVGGMMCLGDTEICWLVFRIAVYLICWILEGGGLCRLGGQERWLLAVK